MNTNDISRVKGQIKSAIQQWGNSKIDEIFPGKPQMKAFAKNGLNNILAKNDDRLNKWMDTFMLFAGSEDGSIDMDHVVDMSVEMFKELEPHKYQFEFMDVEIGRGEVVLYLPDNMFFNLILGKSGKIRMTAEDILEIKNFLTI